MNVTVIIPAHNEEDRIAATLTTYLRYFGQRLHFLIVINGTTDRTEEVVEPFVAQHPGVVESLTIPARIGKGGAVLEGFRRATGDVVGYLDADGATSPEEFQKLLAALEQGADGAIASRYKPGSVARRTFVRKVIGAAFRGVVHLLFGLPFYDTQVGAKLFRAARIKRILPELRTRNMAFDVELLAFLLQDGARIREVATAWREVPGAAQGWQRHLVRTGLEMLRTLFGLRRRLTKRSRRTTFP